MISITILGEPCSKANQRRLVKGKGGRPMFIKSAKALAYIEEAKKQLDEMDLEPIQGDVRVGIRIWYKTRRPDLDESLILDLLQGYAYENDRQVKEKHVYHELDRDNPRAKIEVIPL